MNKKATIYTGTGDDGTTSLIGGERVSKDNKRVQAYGTIDELNAHMGLLNVALTHDQTRQFIERIEHNMLNIGCCLANCKENRYDLTDEEIAVLQEEGTTRMNGILLHICGIPYLQFCVPRAFPRLRNDYDTDEL